ncbi:hypothetical protein BpHYR1_024751 [Brachionus plicatilis]|uniref:Uncharacterized protein n=1 Tax=Brachionus plicatilis TaxID=10195 RepID=A0A3M7T5K5_BRAPC|nr:hypothetical protein BpHYR1_024751 [Brachionus plicatilis]
MYKLVLNCTFIYKIYWWKNIERVSNKDLSNIQLHCCWMRSVQTSPLGGRLKSCIPINNQKVIHKAMTKNQQQPTST